MIRIFDSNEKNIYFNEKAAELSNLTGGAFRLEKNIDDMKLILKGLILDSELICNLENMNIKEYSLNDLEQYANTFKNEIDTEIPLRAIELYKMLNCIQQ